jgi:hypothetical protein
MSHRRTRCAIAPLALLIALTWATSASAWQVKVNVHGAGKVVETTPAKLMDCTVPVSGRSNSSSTACLAGSPSGDYQHGWIVRFEAQVPVGHFDRGWRFQKWVDSSAAKQVNCDPQGTTGDHTSVGCQFQIFDNLETNLYFVDMYGPQDTSIMGGPSSPTKNTAATFTFNSGDPDAFYDCRLDRPGTTGEWYACGSPSDKSEAISPLTTNGTYTMRVRGRDPSGNVDETPASWSWTVDTVAPTVTISGQPSHGATTSATSASLSATASEGGTTMTCTFDGVASPCSTNRSGLGDGTHTFTARATDAAGNVGPVATRTWTVDTSFPTVTITGSPADGTVTNATSAQFSVQASAGTPSCTLDGQPTACDSQKTGLSDGEHTFTAQATNGVGNTGSASRTWTVDTVAPELTIDGGPAHGSTVAADDVAFTVNAPGAVAIGCTIDGAATPCDQVITGLDDGAHTFEAVATDAAGNQDTATRTWTVDTTAPGVTLTGGPAEGSTVAATSASFTVGAPGAASLSCTIDGGPTPCDAPVSGLGDGQHTFTVTAADAVGNERIASRTWTVDATPPNTGITGGPGEGSVTDSSAAFTFVATEPGSSFECSLDGQPFAPCSSPHLLEGLANGQHVLEVRARDAVGNVDPTPARRGWSVGTVTVDPPKDEESLPLAPARLSAKWRVKGRRTTVRRLRLGGLVAGARVELRCKGKGCPVKRRAAKAAAGRVDLRRLLKRKPLRAGQRLTVTVTAPGHLPRTITLKVRKGKKPAVS